jgi:hypothetical protein
MGINGTRCVREKWGGGRQGTERNGKKILTFYGNLAKRTLQNVPTANNT